MQYRCTWPVWPCSSGFLGWSSTRAPPLVPRSWGTKVCRSLLVNPHWIVFLSHCSPLLFSCCNIPFMMLLFTLLLCIFSIVSMFSFLSTANCKQHNSGKLCQHSSCTTALYYRMQAPHHWYPAALESLLRFKFLAKYDTVDIQIELLVVWQPHGPTYHQRLS